MAARPTPAAGPAELSSVSSPLTSLSSTEAPASPASPPGDRSWRRGRTERPAWVPVLSRRVQPALLSPVLAIFLLCWPKNQHYVSTQRPQLCRNHLRGRCAPVIASGQLPECLPTVHYSQWFCFCKRTPTDTRSPVSLGVDQQHGAV